MLNLSSKWQEYLKQQNTAQLNYQLVTVVLVDYTSCEADVLDCLELEAFKRVHDENEELLFIPIDLSEDVILFLEVKSG